jgi:DNA end-binding protein Ku
MVTIDRERASRVPFWSGIGVRRRGYRLAQAIWTGSISFGLVMLPVRLYPATAPKQVRFHEFDAGSGRRIRHQRVIEEPSMPTVIEGIEDIDAAPAWSDQEARALFAPAADPGEPPLDAAWPRPEPRPVAYQDVMLGYEVSPGETVLLSRDEILALRPERSRTVEIEGFVDLAEIDPVYFEKSYYAVPQREPGAERAYALLVRAMSDAEMVGIGRIVLRTREHLAALRPKGEVLVLETLYHADEIRDPAEVLPAGSAEAGERELAVARQLIGILRTGWDPSGYEDRDRERLLEAIAAKARGGETIREPEPVPVADVSDLMAELRASVEAAKAKIERDKRAG